MVLFSYSFDQLKTMLNKLNELGLQAGLRITKKILSCWQMTKDIYLGMVFLGKLVFEQFIHLRDIHTHKELRGLVHKENEGLTVIGGI